MGTEKLANKSTVYSASYRMRNRSLPLKKRKYRLNLIRDADDSQNMATDSSANDEKCDDLTSSQYSPNPVLSSTSTQVSPDPSSLPASDASSPHNVKGSFPENSIGATKNLPRWVTTTPLPTGCHWPTPRNKSYCRRQPCYSGSKFCKLHYKHYANASKRPRPNGKQDQPAHTFVHKTAPGLGGAPMLPNIMHQDKRFTEAPGEVRCLATTTRGRPCAYAQVHETKYCYLHSQYEKSRPVPRRNSFTMGMSAISPNTSSSSTSQSPLCSLPSCAWLKQSVLISSGPLKDRTGTVEKWGNGWVSVRVPEVGLHNKRSFELLLTPVLDGDHPEDEASTPRPAESISSSRVTQVPDSSSDESSQTSPNRSTVKSPVPTLIDADESAPQYLVSPQAV